MRTCLTKLCLVLCFCVLSGLGWWKGTPSRAQTGAPPAAQTGAPALGDFPAENDCTACHTGAVNTGDATIARAATPASYLPNQEVVLALGLNQAGRRRFGFQATALDANGQKVGEWIVTEPARTQLITATSAPFAGRSYIFSTLAGSAPVNPNTGNWTFNWKAPPQRVGRVTIYFALTAANDDGKPEGDLSYTSRLVLDPGVPPLATVSAASFTPNEAVAPEAIVAGFGESLAQSVVTGTMLPLPLELGGVRVAVRDSNGTQRDAPLFFVSPTQLNYLVPLGTANGRATVAVRRQSDLLAEGALNVEAVAPGLFSANASGYGVAAAIIVRVQANGQQSFEPVARLNPANNRFEAVPIDLGPVGEEVFLILFGSGFRLHNSLREAGCTIGNLPAEMLFAGAQGGLAGVDQANIRLPRALAGRGTVNVALRFGNKAANTVTINVK